MPGYRYEEGAGGGGGPSVDPTCVELRTYEFEAGAGGGGGNHDSEQRKVTLYAVDHKIEYQQRRVAVQVSLNFPKAVNEEWRQTVGVPEDAIQQLQAHDDEGNALQKKIDDPDRAVIVVNDDQRRLRAIRIFYKLPFDRLFNRVDRVSRNRLRFQYSDLFWCDLSADVFRVSFNYPDYLKIDTVDPMPFELRSSNEMSWTVEDYHADARFKVRLDGVLGSR
jgi:hypothetical protein